MNCVSQLSYNVEQCKELILDSFSDYREDTIQILQGMFHNNLKINHSTSTVTKIVLYHFNSHCNFFLFSFFLVSYHRIVVLAILATLVIAFSAAAVYWWCMHKPSGLTSRRILRFRNVRPVETKLEVPTVEESILISGLERNDDL